MSYLVNAHDGSPEPRAQAVKLCPKGLQVASLESSLGRAELAAEQGSDGVDDHEPHHAPSQQQGQPPRDALLEGVLHTQGQGHRAKSPAGTSRDSTTASITAAPAQGQIVKAAGGSLSLTSNHIWWFY